MTRVQLLLIACTAIVAAGLYFFAPKTNESIKEEETVQTSQTSSYRSALLAEVDGLLPEHAQSLDSLTTLLLDEKDSIAQTDILNQLVLFWQLKAGDFNTAFWMDSLASVASSNPLFQQMSGLAFIEASPLCPDSSCLREVLRKAVIRSKMAYTLDSSNTECKADELYARIQISAAPMREIVALRTLANDEPRNLRANLYMGQLSIQSGQYEKAEQRYRQVMEIFPAYLEARFGLAESLYKQEKVDEAIAVLEDVKALSRDDYISKAAAQILEQIRISN